MAGRIIKIGRDAAKPAPIAQQQVSDIALALGQFSIKTGALPEIRQFFARALAPANTQAIGKVHRIHCPCRCAADRLKLKAAILQQRVQHAPCIGAMRAAALKREIDRLHAADALPEPASLEFILWLHRAFYEDATEPMLTIKAGDRTLRMTPGEMRSRADEDVAVGRHIPPSSERVAAFMDYFADKYRLERLGSGSRIIAIPAAHHRLNFIHPFLDGNGRVSRLMSHAMALKAGIGAHGLWSISRGLARGLESRSDYKRMMDHADMPRQGDLDGRGNLSRRALLEFTAWFLKVSLDQVAFMSSLFELETLISRLKLYVDRRGLKAEALPLLEQTLQRGELPRGDAERVTGLKERSARDLLAALVSDGILGSDTPKGAVSLRFPLHAVEILFPSLFPET